MLLSKKQSGLKEITYSKIYCNKNALTIKSLSTSEWRQKKKWLSFTEKSDTRIDGSGWWMWGKWGQQVVWSNGWTGNVSLPSANSQKEFVRLRRGNVVLHVSALASALDFSLSLRQRNFQGPGGKRETWQ